jgi:Mg-chelatase subunit ChlD
VSLAAVTVAAEARPQVEVCFVLDTTGSMSGLIEGAKAKIWSIANQMVAAEPTPVLRIALIGYRDRGDAYVTRVFDLSDDIDTVYSNLQQFSAGGGGDTPESVNQALHEAVTEISWSRGRETLKIIFLVGDCPPHMDYSDDVKYQDSCQLAVKRDLIVNTVQCGSYDATTEVWQEIAHRAEGTFVAIGQSGDMQVVSTPMDERLAELNVAVGRTLMPYGGAKVESEVRAKQAMAEAAAAPAVADRLAYNLATGKAVQGGGDLIDDLHEGRITLDDLKEEDLPAQLKKLAPDQRQAHIDQTAEKRRQLRAEIEKLVRQRRAHIEAEMRALEEGGGNAFDQQVARMLREQAERKGITYMTGESDQTEKP